VVTDQACKELKWIHFHETGIKILGMHFSHNKKYLYKNNFERILENFKTTLLLWKTRALTLIGKIQIVRTLGLSKLYFVCSKTGVSESFIKLVKSEVVNFIWNGRKAKIKYNTLIGTREEGGPLKLPDFGSMVKSSLFKWAVRLLDGGSKYWKVLPMTKLETIGGINCMYSI